MSVSNPKQGKKNWRTRAILDGRACVQCGQPIASYDEERFVRDGRLCWDCVKIDGVTQARFAQENDERARPDGPDWDDLLFDPDYYQETIDG